MRDDSTGDSSSTPDASPSANSTGSNSHHNFQEDDEDMQHELQSAPDYALPAASNGMPTEAPAAAATPSATTSELAKDVDSLKRTCTILSHQLNMIMGALRVPRCRCTTCEECVARLQPLPSSHIQPSFPHHPPPCLPPFVLRPLVPPTHHILSPPSAGGVPQNVPHQVAAPLSSSQPVATLPAQQHSNAEHKHEAVEETDKQTEETIRIEDEPTKLAPSSETSESEAAANALLSQLFPGGLQNISNLAAASASPGAAGTPFKPFGGELSSHSLPPPSKGGRKSKYCTPEEKKLVAEFARVHGAANAARKFGIPPSVAAYYQRKEQKQHHQPSALHATPQPLVLPPLATSQPSGAPATPEAEPAGVSEDSTSSPLLNDIKMKLEQPSTPTFLRGRGRGRPKLIGDELDAELVDYMVQVKQANPRGHLSASQALVIAREYILHKAPGLLEEHGGNIKLKLTWAMKLVSRITERQKEIELGLPAGSLSNMSKSHLQNLPGTNLVADMMAQNILSQHLSNVISQIGGAPSHHSDASFWGSTTPEITNVKELTLSSTRMATDDGEDGATGEIAENGEMSDGTADVDGDDQGEDGETMEEAASPEGEESAENNAVPGLEAALSRPFAFANTAF